MDSKDIEIVVDSREKVKQRTLLKHNGIEFTVKALSCGDYAAYADDGKVTIERKAISDFMQSLLSGRLEDQLKRLASEPIPILLITGSYKEVEKYYKKSKITEEHVQGAIASAIVRFGLRSVIWIQDGYSDPHNDGLMVATKLLKKIAEGKLDQIKDRRIKRTENPQREVVKLLLNVPTDVAQNLLDRFSTVRCIVNADDNELLKVPGIGPSRLQRIRFMLDNVISK